LNLADSIDLLLMHVNDITGYTYAFSPLPWTCLRAPRYPTGDEGLVEARVHADIVRGEETKPPSFALERWFAPGTSAHG